MILWVLLHEIFETSSRLDPLSKNMISEDINASE
jgi:hypothetical protein